MEDTSENRIDKLNEKPLKHITIGILAHVDAGKTTLSEGMLYLSGEIRKLGRVDNQDAFLDTHELEKARGITIFSKQARLNIGNLAITVLDTPGHVDFSAEMERTLQVLDYGILVIGGADGIQGHTRTLWKLLESYRIPTFLFINKMDQPGTDLSQIMEQLKQKLDGNCIDFTDTPENIMENLATCDEAAMEKYLDKEKLDQEDFIRLTSSRKAFPCYFGSALKLEGIENLLNGLEQYTRPADYPEEFGARIFKIARDDQGNRLTYMKITGGALQTKDILTNKSLSLSGGEENQQEIWAEKVNQIRLYSGSRYETIPKAEAGTICAVTGLTRTFPGEGLGRESKSPKPILQPALTYQIQLPSSCNVHEMLGNLRRLEEEDPQLHIVWNQKLQEIHAQVMGEVQIEILKSLIQERFQVPVEFGSGSILYRETILEPVEGVGHFEPLRHYAEVHLLLEPGEMGSGLTFAAHVSEDDLDKNWQRLILTHLQEREHPGVLTGSPITDMKITLTAGKAHLKHTEGGDFREATYRAVRQGLKKAQSILLEPWYTFRLEVPEENIGRAMSDIQRMGGNFQPPLIEHELHVLSGSVPVSSVQDYQTQVASYTKGRGRLYCTWGGYQPCHNAEEIIESFCYDSELDPDNPTGSVFCSHGSGFLVTWDKVEDYMHLESCLPRETPSKESKDTTAESSAPQTSSLILDKELEEIFQRTYGPIKRKLPSQDYREPKPAPSRHEAPLHKNQFKQQKQEKDSYLLVDGYNIIFAWEELKDLAETDLGAARDKLMDILSNYQGYKECNLILVFDAYKVEGNTREIFKYHNIHVVYTKEAETADQYIEKTAHKMSGKYQVTVATSDALEQIIIQGQGCQLLSARELKEEISLTAGQIRREYLSRRKNSKNYLFNYLDDDLADTMEDIRLGKKL
ncbi:MAG: GTP-binding protein [Lachnospiraceae bacterium]|nr:GTP-binding protein [Lachnospiraceae bacterium]